MDVNNARNDIVEHHDLRNVDDTYTFYYDETNNVRKLILTADGLNVAQLNNFVLAGIMHRGDKHGVSFSGLFEKLNFQKTVKEVKFKHISKSNFVNTLGSRKLHLLLNWLHENNFYIHYFNLNLLYWSLTDIVDSILHETKESLYFANHMTLKSDLYKVAKSNKQTFLATLNEFKYPNIEPNKTNEFSSWLLKYVKRHSLHLSKERATFLEAFLSTSLALDELPFITGNRDNVMIEDFLGFHLRTLYIFKNSNHIFDEEHVIEKLLAKHPLTEHGKPISNYSFVKSDTNKEIQVSDIITGFLGKYFAFIKDSSFQDIKSIKSELTDFQSKTLISLKRLIDTSDDLSKGLFNTVISEDEHRKHNYFLHDKGRI